MKTFLSGTFFSGTFLKSMAITSFLTLGSIAQANVIYTADSMPRDDGWTLASYAPYEAGHVMLDENPGILYLNDPSRSSGSASHYYKDISIDGNADVVYAEWDVNVTHSDKTGTFFALTRGTGRYDVYFEITQNSVRSGMGGSAQVVADDAFHTYRAELEDNTYRLYQDNILLFSGSTSVSNSDQLRVEFGLGSSSGTAEFYLDEVRAGVGSIASSEVPEPTSLFILGLGLLGLRFSKNKSKGLK